jgi:glycerol uptake facilitator-like aquaporin
VQVACQLVGATLAAASVSQLECVRHVPYEKMAFAPRTLEWMLGLRSAHVHMEWGQTTPHASIADSTAMWLEGVGTMCVLAAVRHAINELSFRRSHSYSATVSPTWKKMYSHVCVPVVLALCIFLLTNWTGASLNWARSLATVWSAQQHGHEASRAHVAYKYVLAQTVGVFLVILWDVYTYWQEKRKLARSLAVTLKELDAICRWCHTHEYVDM